MKALRPLLIFTFVLVSSIGLLTCGKYSNTTNSASTAVTTITIPPSAAGMGPAAFGTNPLHVAMGTKVVWQNADVMAHTATSDTGVWDTGAINAGDTSAATTFLYAGNYPYHCSIHGAASMSGTIIVP